MKTILFFTVLGLVTFGLAVCGSNRSSGNLEKQTTGESGSYDSIDKAEINDPATEFLKSLTPPQKNKALVKLDDETRTKWHYLPATMYSREGIQLSELTEKQKELAFKLLRTHVSQTGYTKVRKIIGLEKILAEVSGNSSVRDPEKYHLAIYGNPAVDKLWAWSFEGHHISLNFTVSGDKIAFVPRFLGANPATIRSGTRKGERTLAEEADLGMELVNSFGPEQKKTAIFRDQTSFDIFTRNESEVSPLDPVGIKFADLNKSQKDILQKLIGVYLSTMPEKLAGQRMEKLKKEDFEEIRFAWAGATEEGKPHYYRIQGKTFLIEYDNSQNSGNHIHTVWRDFQGDFGRDLIREHYQTAGDHK